MTSSLRSKIPLSCLAVLALLLITSCQNTQLKCEQVREQKGIQTPLSATATPRSTDYQWMTIAQWYGKHSDQVAIANRGNADVIFLGDSITESWNWGEEQQQIFNKYFSRYPSAVLGIGGDQTQNVLWRLQYGLKGKLKPKVVVLLIGVNNFGHSNHSAKEVYAGIKAILDQIKLNYPEAKVLLNGIFPYDEWNTSPNRQRVIDTNLLLAKLDDNKRIFFYDFGGIFLDTNDNIPASLMEDFLHPSPKGLELYAKKISPIINRWTHQ